MWYDGGRSPSTAARVPDIVQQDNTGLSRRTPSFVIKFGDPVL